MTDYDPRTATGIPTEPVGSLPRPAPAAGGLRGVRRRQDRQGRSWRREQDAAVKDSIERVRGDRRRRSSPTASSAGRASRPTRSPTRWPAPAWPTTSAGRRPVLRDLRRRPRPPAAQAGRRPVPVQDLRRRHADASRSAYAHQADEAGGHRAVDARAALPARRRGAGLLAASEFEDDLVDECEKDIRQAFEAGAARVSIDFTEGRLATREDPRNPWTGRGHAAALHRAEQPGAWTGSAPRSGANIGMHTCPGGDRDSVHSADVPYNDLLPSMFEHQRRLLPDPAGQRARQGPGLPADRRAQPRRRRRRDRRWPTSASINPLQPAGRERRRRSATSWSGRRTSSRRSGSARPTTAASRRSRIDEKPNHGSPDYARDIAFQKITNRVEGTRLAAEKLGLG